MSSSSAALTSDDSNYVRYTIFQFTKPEALDYNKIPLHTLRIIKKFDPQNIDGEIGQLQDVPEENRVKQLDFQKELAAKMKKTVEAKKEELHQEKTTHYLNISNYERENNNLKKQVEDLLKKQQVLLQNYQQLKKENQELKKEKHCK